MQTTINYISRNNAVRIAKKNDVVQKKWMEMGNLNFFPEDLMNVSKMLQARVHKKKKKINQIHWLCAFIIFAPLLLLLLFFRTLKKQK